MNDFGPLFTPSPDRAPRADEPHTWGVLELNQAIERALKHAFPGEIWLRGEIQGLARTRMRKHNYFDLVEKDPASDQVLATIPVALLSWNRAKVERMMGDAPGFELDDDVEVRIRCEMGFYPPWGKLQLVMTGVDPTFTLGQMAANRERILRALAADGLLDRNAQLAVPLVPQRIGLVTSIGSAAYNDFVDEIRRSGLGLHVLACDARVQGAETERSVIAALRTLARRRCDVIALVRGGGSRADLAGFDSEAIARAIATLGVPVFTGIGHEIDTSVADAVAHTAHKTPTACAAALVGHARHAVERMEETWVTIVRLARQDQQSQGQLLLRTAKEVGRGARDALRHRGRDLDGMAAALQRAVGDTQRRRADRLRAALVRARQLVALRLADRGAALRLAERRLAPDRLERGLQRRAEALARHRHRLGQLARRRIGHEESLLVSRHATVRALDPHRVLARGFSLTYDAGGHLLREVSSLVPGARLRSVVAGGAIDSRVDAVHPVPPSQEEPR
jgi:exodeoxyribonuclease VII large subunit